MPKVTTTRITTELYKFTGFDLVNVYLFPQKKLLIDAGNPLDKGALKKAINAILSCIEIKYIILTHFHYDHAGNIDLFPNARIYAHEDEIKGLKQFGLTLTFNKEVLQQLSQRQLLPISSHSDPEFHYLATHGHTPGGLSLLYTDPQTNKRYLFTGDVLFRDAIGRTDFPSSSPEKMKISLILLRTLEYDELLPGHDY